MEPAQPDRVAEQEEARAPADGTARIHVIRGTQTGVAAAVKVKVVAVKAGAVVLAGVKEVIKTVENKKRRHIWQRCPKLQQKPGKIVRVRL
jgi:hypothetical protein